MNPEMHPGFDRGFASTRIEPKLRHAPKESVVVVSELPENPPLVQEEKKERVSETQEKTVRLKDHERITDQYGDVYEIQHLLGEGGMGAVYAATNTRTDLECAIKIMLPNHRETPREHQTRFDRFKREIRALVKVHRTCPFILPARDVIEFAHDGASITGFVTDLVEGENLEQLLKERAGELPRSQVVQIAGELAVALMSLQDAGIVHRDIKPANIFLQHMKDQEGNVFDDPLVRLGDFGIAKFTQDSQEMRAITNLEPEQQKDLSFMNVTGEGLAIGSPRTIAPEQALGETVTSASDLYSVGAVLYEALSGERLFSEKKSVNELLLAQVQEIPKTLTEKGAKNVPKELEQLVMQLLSKDPLQRGTPSELFGRLKEIAQTYYPELLSKVPFMYSFKKELPKKEVEMP